ncbi:MAG: hypothetical protein KA185_10995, partial [Vitreoscilla sp.]|nr:hypothetical protein [Vitreoscilla sp.]
IRVQPDKKDLRKIIICLSLRLNDDPTGSGLYPTPAPPGPGRSTPPGLLMNLNLHTPARAALACGVIELLSSVTLKAARRTD